MSKVKCNIKITCDKKWSNEIDKNKLLWDKQHLCLHCNTKLNLNCNYSHSQTELNIWRTEFNTNYLSYSYNSKKIHKKLKKLNKKLI